MLAHGPMPCPLELWALLSALLSALPVLWPLWSRLRARWTR